MTAPALRLLGGALLALGGGLLGQTRLSELQRQRDALRALSAALGRLAAELELLQSPLGAAFSRLTDCPFFRQVAAGFLSRPLETLWRETAAAQPLPEEARRALAPLGAILGRADAARQSAEIGLVRQRLTAAADELEREIAARGRRLPLLGAALGAIVAAVLF